MDANGILLLYSKGLGGTAPVVTDSVRAFAAHSRFPVWQINTYYGFPAGLNRIRCRIIVLHFTLFYDEFSPLEPEFLEYLDRNADSYLVAMFQDEQAYLPKRLAFCNNFGVDCVYTLFDAEHAQRVYGAGTGASEIVSYLPGYVSEELRRVGRRRYVPDDRRPIDVGYRGRRPPLAWGPSAQEKYEIAGRFSARARDLDLRLDIETDESKRLYGRAWHRFIASCRATLGTESGTELPAPRFLLRNGDADKTGEIIPYRTISPRHLEAAALRSCQILFEGGYSGLLQPMVHYIPLKKDFTNFDEVVSRYRDPRLRREISGNAHRDLVEDSRISYQKFIERLDGGLANAGFRPTHRLGGRALMAAVSRSPRPHRRAHIWHSKTQRVVHAVEAKLRAAIGKATRLRSCQSSRP
jgi:hypothetical protein